MFICFLTTGFYYSVVCGSVIAPTLDSRGGGSTTQYSLHSVTSTTGTICMLSRDLNPIAIDCFALNLSPLWLLNRDTRTINSIQMRVFSSPLNYSRRVIINRLLNKRDKQRYTVKCIEKEEREKCIS